MLGRSYNRCSYSYQLKKQEMVDKELAAVIVRRTRARYQSHKSRCEKLHMYTNSRKILAVKNSDSRALWKTINIRKNPVRHSIPAEDFACHFSKVNNPTNMSDYEPCDNVKEFSSMSEKENCKATPHGYLCALDLSPALFAVLVNDMSGVISGALPNGGLKWDDICLMLLLYADSS